MSTRTHIEKKGRTLGFRVSVRTTLHCFRSDYPILYVIVNSFVDLIFRFVSVDVEVGVSDSANNL